MARSRPLCKEFLPSFFIVEYLIFAVTLTLFLFRLPVWNTATCLLIVPALFFYPLLYLAPSLLITTAAAGATVKLEEKRALLRRILTGTAAFLTTFVPHLLLLMDAGLYFRYSYHINPHVLNIFTTPGGFESMGLRTSEILLLGGGIVLPALVHLGVLLYFIHFPILSFAGKWELKRPCIKYYAGLCLFFGAAFLISFTTYTYEHFSMNSQVLLAADALPLYIKGTSSSLYRKLGCKQPDREAIRIKLAQTSLQNYPQAPIVRDPRRPKYNVVWIACESWAVKLYTPEIMPATTSFARKGIHFTNHYSGGNVTRQGVFSMFYALPGNYWHPFFAARRGPLFIDWLKEDGYRFKCITSSKFTYPEFDQTVFFQVPQKDLHSDDKGKTWERDQRNVKLFIKSIEEGADSGTPFFSFMFFESPHNPYEFPPEAAFTKDYIDPFNAAGVTAKDGPRIFNRAANSARHLDMCLDKVFQTLEKKDLLKNTIVVIAGDHGEEYFERGYLGHSSSFVREQTKTPLILYYPGISPGKYEKMSSHLDIIPMLARFFGVKNAPQDYSCGYDLLSNPDLSREYALIANWSEIFFAGSEYKSLLPVDALSLAKQVITDGNDNPLPDVAPFYKRYSKALVEVQRDLSRFSAPPKK